jgi:MFS transporter, Spinster family, sphingosine-1-phosphate transporter
MGAKKSNYVIGSAGAGLGILAFINLLSYLDRYIVAAVAESLKQAGMGLSDADLGTFMSAFLIVYTVVAPIFGALGDRISRPRLIAVGVAIWSFATALSGFAVNYLTLLAARAAVGVGEASYVTIAPSLLSDLFPLRQRGRVMAIFFCAIPVGSALGYVVGGLVDKHYGWRAAFFVAGIPGLVLASLCLLLRDPPRGVQEEVSTAGAAGTGAPRIGAPAKSAGTASVKQTWLTYGRLLRYRAYALTVLGYAAYTFAVGGLAFWMPTFLERSRGMTRSEATVSFGTIVVITGFVGTFLGGWMGDYFAKRSQRAYLWLSAFSCLIAAPLVWVALTTRSPHLYLSSMVIAQLCLFLSTGPINAAIANLVTATERASAIALSVFAIHLLGDVLSPPLIGALSDGTSLESAVKIVPVAVMVGGIIWLWAASTKPRFELKQTPAAASGVPSVTAVHRAGAPR